MLDKLIDGLGRVADNVWAFLLFVIAAFVAIGSAVIGLIIVYHFHAADTGIAKDLLSFAGTIAMTGAALFHGKDKGGAP